MSGRVSSRLVVVNEDSMVLDQFKDVIITSPGHDQTIKYDSASFVNLTMSLSDLTDMNLSSLSHDDVLIWVAFKPCLTQV